MNPTDTTTQPKPSGGKSSGPRSPTDVEPLVDQLRDLFGRTAYSHKTHIIQAGMENTCQNRIKTVEIILSAITTTGLITALLGSGAWGLGISTFASTLLLGVIFYTKDFDLGTVAEQHKRTADELWLLREQLVSLLTDIQAGTVAPDSIVKRRDALIDKLGTVYSTAKVTSSAAYAAAQKALKIKEDLSFSTEEIDAMLQPTLRKAANQPA
jgi:hypothetical protein